VQNKVNIQLHFQLPHPKKMAAQILQNLTKLCEKTNVNESLITALYSKAVIDSEFKEVLVRF
jgi:Lhr-like helicase